MGLPKGDELIHTHKHQHHTVINSIKTTASVIYAATLLLIVFLFKRDELNAAIQEQPDLDTTSREYAQAVFGLVKRIHELDVDNLYQTEDQKFEVSRILVQESQLYDGLTCAQIAGDIDGLIARSAEFY